MNNINSETYQTLHNPDDIFMVPANQLQKENLQAFCENVISHNPWIFLEVFTLLLIPQFKKFENDRNNAYKTIFESSILSLVHVRTHVPSQHNLGIKSISLTFSNLEKERDILSFARKYGLLGVLDWGWNSYYPTHFETINTWHTYIAHIKRLIKLYKVLMEKKRGKEIDIIGEFFSLEEKTVYRIGVGNIKEIKISWTEKYSIRKMENQLLNGVNDIPFPAPDLPREVEESIEYDGLLGSYILARLIKNGLDEAVTISFSSVFRSDSSPIGYTFNETYSSKYLLGAIYQDLWRLITNKIPIKFCNYCGRTLEEKGKKSHCNESCRQMAYRERKKSNQQC